MGDIEFAHEAFGVSGTDRATDLFELVERLQQLDALPADVPANLYAELAEDSPPSAFPNGRHVTEVEVGPDTGVVTVERYCVVDDFGTLINPMLAEGQVQGWVAQGLGQALLEHTVYDDDAQLLSGSFWITRYRALLTYLTCNLRHYQRQPQPIRWAQKAVAKP